MAAVAGGSDGTRESTGVGSLLDPEGLLELGRGLLGLLGVLIWELC